MQLVELKVLHQTIFHITSMSTATRREILAVINFRPNVKAINWRTIDQSISQFSDEAQPVHKYANNDS